MKLLLALLMLVGTGCGQSLVLSGSGRLSSGSVTMGIVCGPPLYNCTRTDLNIVKLPAVVPSVGGLTGAGTIVSDDMGNSNKVLRITDSAFDPSRANVEYVVAGSGSGDMNLFSRPFGGHTLLAIQESGNLAYVVDINNSTLAVTRPYASSYSSTGGWASPYDVTSSWGHTNNLMYQVNHQFLASFDWTDWMTGPKTTPPVAVNQFDFTELTPGLPNYSAGNCLPSGYTSPTWIDDTSSSSDDQTFASAWSISGGQGTGTKFAAYVVGKGCTVLDTTSGVVTGDWGFTGTLTLPISGGFNIHNQKISHDGKYAIISCTSNGNGCGALQFLWQIGTNSFVAAASIPTSGGHGHAGYSNIVNGVNSPSGQIDIRPLANPSAVTQIFDSFHLPPGIAAPDDFHSGWNNVDLLDTYPFLMAFYQPYTAPNTGIVCGLASVSGSTLTFVSGHLFDTGWTGNIDVEGAAFPIASVASTTSLTVTGSPGTSASTSFCHNPITYAWPEEIVAVSPWTGLTHRFGHCFTTGSDAHIFGAEFCIGSVSQDGQFYAFPSNWLGTLGSNAGSASCTSTTNCRSDVFLMTLK